MNTIHSTFNRVNTSYTVIGSNNIKPSDDKNRFSVLLLNRGGRPYREELYSEFKNLNIEEVISIQVGTKSHFDLEKESLENENLKFLILQKKVSVGEMINIGLSESTSNSVLVMWDDMIINTKSISYRVFQKIVEDGRICTVPQFISKDSGIIPSLMTPLFHKELLKVVALEHSANLKSLYPHMYVGIYNKEKFIQLGGYDIDIRNSYWQKLDFGLRANLWGESIKAHSSFKIQLESIQNDIEDITPDQDYRLYCLKNISVTIKHDQGFLSLKRFFSYYDKSGSSIFDAYHTFRNVQNWVKINKYRFKMTAPELTKTWDNE